MKVSILDDELEAELIGAGNSFDVDIKLGIDDDEKMPLSFK